MVWVPIRRDYSGSDSGHDKIRFSTEVDYLTIKSEYISDNSS